MKIQGGRAGHGRGDRYKCVKQAALLILVLAAGCVPPPGSLDPNDPLSVAQSYEPMRQGVEGALLFLDTGSVLLDGLEADGTISGETAAEIRALGTDVYFRLDRARTLDLAEPDPGRSIAILRAGITASMLNMDRLIGLIPLGENTTGYRIAARLALVGLFVYANSAE